MFKIVAKNFISTILIFALAILNSSAQEHKAIGEEVSEKAFFNSSSYYSLGWFMAFYDV